MFVGVLIAALRDRDSPSFLVSSRTSAGLHTKNGLSAATWRAMKSFVLPMDSRQDSGMLDYRREQAEGSQDDEAGPEAQRAADGVETLVQPGVVEIAVELADAEPEPDQCQDGADPRQERPIGGLQAPFSRELGAGVDHGGER